MKNLLAILFVMCSLNSFSQKNELVYLWPGKVPGEPKEKQPPVINYSFADFNPEFRKQVSEEIIQQVAEESWKEELEYYHIKENRKKEFYDAIQPIVLNRFKALEDLDYEGWVMFSVFIREEYERYLIRFDHVETVIDYGLDEEDINLDHEHFMEKLSIKMEERRENEQKSESSK